MNGGKNMKELYLAPEAELTSFAPQQRLASFLKVPFTTTYTNSTDSTIEIPGEDVDPVTD